MARRWYHVALSVDVDRFSDRQLRRDRYVPTFAGTPDALRKMCREARAQGLEVFPPCDDTDPRGCCVGHEVEST